MEFRNENIDMPNNPDKHYPYVNSIIDLRPSCTKEDAVAKLLGFMKGHIRHDYPEDDNDITIEHLTYTYSLGHPLDIQLSLLKNAALSRFSDAIEAKAPEDVLNQLADVIHECDEISNKAGAYLCGIEDELAKGESSELRIDQATSDSSGEVYITLRSLDQWAREKYGISILSDTLTTNTPKQQELSQATNKNPIANKQLLDKKPKLREQEKTILDEIKKLKYDPESLPRNKAGKPGVKFEVRNSLKENKLFKGARVFDKAWERLRESDEIANVK